MLSFYSLVAYHIKCFKSTMHTKMRRKAKSMQQVLNRAIPDSVKKIAQANSSD